MRIVCIIHWPVYLGDSPTFCRLVGTTSGPFLARTCLQEMA
jgi:hypothetical protein